MLDRAYEVRSSFTAGLQGWTGRKLSFTGSCRRFHIYECACAYRQPPGMHTRRRRRSFNLELVLSRELPSCTQDNRSRTHSGAR